jgi:excinuclease UvrABC nuclease subunit
VPEAQLRLFPDPKPLLERFGADFFRTIPRRPGIYVMTGEHERVLYIGKARNLRQRLCSYKYPRSSRKLARLTCRVRSITWELCEDAATASMRENELLRLHKPAFNVLNTRSEHYPFIGLRVTGTELVFRVTKSSHPLPREQVFGAFKGLPLVRCASAALSRLLWRAEHPTLSLLQLPPMLLHGKNAEAWKISWHRANDWQSLTVDLLSGRNDELIKVLDALPAASSHFEQAFHAQDIAWLQEFYARGPQRNAQLRQLFCLDAPAIAQTELDDLLVLREQYANAVAPGPTVG